MSIEEDINDLVKKYTTNCGCYRFATIVHFLTGWNIGDLHTDGYSCEKTPSGEYKYELRSSHAFCYDPDGNIFDVEGIISLDLFLNKWLAVKNEYIGKYIDDRLWSDKLNYMIITKNIDDDDIDGLLNPKYFIEEKIIEVKEVYSIIKDSYPTIDIDEKYNYLTARLNEKLIEFEKDSLRQFINHKETRLHIYDGAKISNRNGIFKLTEQIKGLMKIPDPIKRTRLINDKLKIIQELELKCIQIDNRINELQDKINSTKLKLSLL